VAKKAILTRAALLLVLSVFVAGCGGIKIQIKEQPNYVWDNSDPLVVVEEPSFFDDPGQPQGDDATGRKVEMHPLLGFENPILDRLRDRGVQARTAEQQSVLLQEAGLDEEELRKEKFTAAEFADMLERAKTSGHPLEDYAVVTVVHPYRDTDKYIPPRTVPVMVPDTCYPFGFYGCGGYWGGPWGYDDCTTVMPMYEPGYTQHYAEVGVTIAIYDMTELRQQLLKRGSEGMSFVDPCWVAHGTVLDADHTKEETLSRVINKIAKKIPIKNKPPRK